MIGIDKESLDSQILEKKHREIREQEETQLEANQMRETIQFLDEQERLMEENRRQRMNQYQETLRQQSMQPKNNALGRCEPLDLDNCGSSSIQRFQGEDTEYKDRIKKQHLQLNRWCSEAVKEKKKQKESQDYEEQEYANYVLEEDELRTKAQLDKEEQIAVIEASVQEENKRIAEEKQKRMKQMTDVEKELEALESRHVLTSPFYCEKSSCDGSNVPSDFKGFGKEKVEMIIKSNEVLLTEKLTVKQEEMKREEEWASQHNYMIQQMEVLELQRKKAKENEIKLQQEILNKQMMEQKEKQEQMKKDRFGEIGYGFFQKFGKTLT